MANYGHVKLDHWLKILNQGDLKNLKMGFVSCSSLQNDFEQLYLEGFLDDNGYLSESHVES